MTRQTTSRSILDVDWDYPVANTFREENGEGTHTVVPKARVALARVDAFKKIAGDDPRPLLVMRECTKCKGSEHALFSRRLNNEKTKLLLNWFHCVKLTPEVTQRNHPFHKLFTSKYPVMPHLFIATANGENRLNFSGAQSQNLMQKALTKMIAVAYKKKPKPAIKSMLMFLSKFDMLDIRSNELVEMIDRAREDHGPNSSQVKKLRKRLAKAEKDKAKFMKSAKSVCDLKLRVVKDTKKVAKLAK